MHAIRRSERREGADGQEAVLLAAVLALRASSPLQARAVELGILREYIVLDEISGPLSFPPAVADRLRLNRSYRSDRVTRG